MREFTALYLVPYISLPVYKKMSETDDERQFSDSSEGNPVRNGLLHSGAKKEGSLTSVCQALYSACIVHVLAISVPLYCNVLQ